MFKIKIIISNDLRELEDMVNNYCSTDPNVIDVDIFRDFTKPRLSDNSIPNRYLAVIKTSTNLEGDEDEQQRN